MNNNIVIHKHHRVKDKYQADVYSENGGLLYHWKPCHRLPYMMRFEVNGREYLLEGCKICRVIRKYELPAFQSKILCKGVSMGPMCQGPGKTIFILAYNTIKQLCYRIGQSHITNKSHSTTKSILRSSEHYPWTPCPLIAYVTLLKETSYCCMTTERSGGSTPNQDRPPGAQNSTLPHQPHRGGNDLRDVLVLPDGTVYAFTHKEMISMDATDGATIQTLLNCRNLDVIWAVSASRDRNNFAISQTSQISVYEVPFQAHRRLILRQILDN